MQQLSYSSVEFPWPGFALIPNCQILRDLAIINLDLARIDKEFKRIPEGKRERERERENWRENSRILYSQSGCFSKWGRLKFIAVLVYIGSHLNL